jgi:hypothetical protein
VTSLLGLSSGATFTWTGTLIDRDLRPHGIRLLRTARSRTLFDNADSSSPAC